MVAFSQFCDSVAELNESSLYFIFAYDSSRKRAHVKWLKLMAGEKAIEVQRKERNQPTTVVAQKKKKKMFEP